MVSIPIDMVEMYKDLGFEGLSLSCYPVSTMFTEKEMSSFVADKFPQQMCVPGQTALNQNATALKTLSFGLLDDIEIFYEHGCVPYSLLVGSYLPDIWWRFGVQLENPCAASFPPVVIVTPEDVKLAYENGVDAFVESFLVHGVPVEDILA